MYHCRTSQGSLGVSRGDVSAWTTLLLATRLLLLRRARIAVPVAAGLLLATPPPVQADVQDPPKRSAPPVETVLRPGTTLVYSYVGYREDGRNGAKFRLGIMTCSLEDADDPPDRTVFSPRCSRLGRVSDTNVDPVWENGTVYAWERHGLGLPDSQTPIIPVEPDRYAFDEPRETLNGLPLKAACYESPESSESGQVRCLTPGLGLVLWQRWDHAESKEEEDFRLVEAVTKREALRNPTRKVSEDGARQLLARWIEAHDRGDFKAYAALYASSFTGVTRAGHKATTWDRDGWLKDRGPLFRRPMKVTAEQVEIHAEPRRATVLFIQHRSGGTHSERGPRLLVVSTEGPPAILYEERMWQKKKPRQ